MLKPKYKRTLEYLKSLVNEYGYFSIDIDEARRKLEIDRSTLYRHLDKLDGYIYKIYEGSFVPDKIARRILYDTYGKCHAIGSLYYIPNGSFDTQKERDIVILRDCLKWSQGSLNHFLKWINNDTLEYESNLHGLSRTTQELLLQFFQYVVDAHFDFDNEYYMDKFIKMRQCF